MQRYRKQNSLRMTVFPLIVLVIPLASCIHGEIVKRSDDVTLQALHNVVLQQVATIQALQADVAALRNLKTQVDKLTKSVAFTARFSTDDVNNGISLGSHSTLKFDTAITNVGNGYDTSTGLFTAPMAGVYCFFLTEMAPNNQGPLSLMLIKEGHPLHVTWAPGSLDIDDQGSTSLVTTKLSAGERVWVETNSGDAVRGGQQTIFTGFLVRAQ